MTTSRTFGSKSPITELDSTKLQQFLAKCMSADQWNKYTDEEKDLILQKLPPRRKPQSHRNSESETKSDELTLTHDSAVNAPVSSDFCTNDPYLRSAIARFKRDLQAGYYEKAWKSKATKANQERMAGNYDEYLQNYANDAFMEQDERDDSTDELAPVSEDEDYNPDQSKKHKFKSGRSKPNSSDSAQVPKP